MSEKICVLGNCVDYPDGGGHLWEYMNWALAFRSIGCEIAWLEPLMPGTEVHEARSRIAALRSRLERYELDSALAVCSQDAAPLAPGVLEGCLSLDEVAGADVLFNFRYDIPSEIVQRFRRTAFMDLDPGELQIWMDKGELNIVPHHEYFTIGETVGKPGARFPDCGLQWTYTKPCVALDWWPPRWAPADAPFTTVAHWYDGWMEDDAGGYGDGKRSGFLPYFELPRRTTWTLELALDLVPEDADQLILWENRWRVCDSHAVSATPWDYQHYIQASSGEFSCCKPHCVRLQNAWISNRTACYMASGKPAVVEHTGPSGYLPDCEGLFRFRTLDQALRSLEILTSDYDRHCRSARAFAEEHFDGQKIATRLLQRALG